MTDPDSELTEAQKELDEAQQALHLKNRARQRPLIEQPIRFDDPEELQHLHDRVDKAKRRVTELKEERGSGRP